MDRILAVLNSNWSLYTVFENDELFILIISKLTILAGAIKPGPEMSKLF